MYSQTSYARFDHNERLKHGKIMGFWGQRWHVRSVEWLFFTFACIYDNPAFIGEVPVNCCCQFFYENIFVIVDTYSPNNMVTQDSEAFLKLVEI